ncbi:flagellar hook-length control protein FliK [Alkalicoccus luteus]|uniref:Flagellar hook-length control protein-like C-terminal domain-containing protein n=1 Tax=Alkalicoccus luteus TaxID=1237094 RepID=A0A969PLE6_9BACI|nr:flagellar hook-length control protein FliK [Alkalicoccus luteus]NJP36350.1 hypothetical protein [Alkalicoccus luteus]
MIIQLLRAAMHEAPLQTKEEHVSQRDFIDLLQLAEEETADLLDQIVPEDLSEEAEEALMIPESEAETIVRELIDRFHDQDSMEDLLDGFKVDTSSGKLVFVKAGHAVEMGQADEADKEDFIKEVEKLVNGELDLPGLMALDKIARDELSSSQNSTEMQVPLPEKLQELNEKAPDSSEVRSEDSDQLLTGQEAEALLSFIQSVLRGRETSTMAGRSLANRQSSEQPAAQITAQDLSSALKTTDVMPVRSDALLQDKPLPDIRVQTFIPLSMQANFQTHSQVQETAGRQEAMIKQFETMVKRLQVQQMQNGSQQLTIRLHPQSLGRLEVTLQQVNGVMQARIMTFTSQARDVMEQTVHQLKQAFQQQNLQLDRVDIQQSVQQWKGQHESKREQQERDPETEQGAEEEQETELDFSEMMESLLEEVNE